ncbi:hypothetical protein GCM10027597_51620 [Saccharopolyspora tripterygii]
MLGDLVAHPLRQLAELVNDHGVILLVAALALPPLGLAMVAERKLAAGVGLLTHAVGAGR